MDIQKLTEEKDLDWVGVRPKTAAELVCTLSRQLHWWASVPAFWTGGTTYKSTH